MLGVTLTGARKPARTHQGCAAIAWLPSPAPNVAASKAIAEEFGVYWADSYSPMKMAVGRGRSIFKPDQIHPNELGHRIIADAVLAATRKR